MNPFAQRTLGRTGLSVCRLGVAASYGAPAEAFEEAFDRGCNYFYWGSGRRKAGMSQAIRNLCGRGCRAQLVIALQTYSRTGLLLEPMLRRRLRSLGLEHADALILGWHNRPPSGHLLERALALREKGLFRFLGMSGHNRALFQKMADTGCFDLFHVRYNAAHRGAETEIFPHLQGDESRPGLVTYTATRWGALLKAKKMPPGEGLPAASDCYRFVLTNPNVDVCLCGPKDIAEMRAALETLDLGPLQDDELARMRRIGDHLHRTARVFR